MHENRETSETPAVQLGRRSAGESTGHTARMHVSEEEHCGIVPMNHSNKDGIASAESEEGRLRLKENTFPFDTYPTQRGTARVPGGRVCGQAMSLAAIHLREEPDALMSARPGLCGGHRATGVPTAINSDRRYNAHHVANSRIRSRSGRTDVHDSGRRTERYPSLRKVQK